MRLEHFLVSHLLIVRSHETATQAQGTTTHLPLWYLSHGEGYALTYRAR